MMVHFNDSLCIYIRCLCVDSERVRERDQKYGLIFNITEYGNLLDGMRFLFMDAVKIN